MRLISKYPQIRRKPYDPSRNSLTVFPSVLSTEPLTPRAPPEVPKKAFVPRPSGKVETACEGDREVTFDGRNLSPNPPTPLKLAQVQATKQA